MKIKLLASAAFACALVRCLSAAPLAQTTAVHTRPDASSPTITYLKAGTEPNATLSVATSTPPGWTAVELKGPFQGYVEKKDMTKGLDVKPGISIRLSPQATAPVLTVAERGDKTVITGLQGRWAQISLEKNLTGYINVADASPTPAATPAAAAVAYSAPSSSPAPMDTPIAPVAAPTTAPGQPAIASSAADAASLPRQLTGKFVSTRNPLRPRRPYDWALEDNTGRRFAYVDISKLLLTEQIDKYVGHFVVVFGAAKPTADGKEIVIQVESLQLLLR